MLNLNKLLTLNALMQIGLIGSTVIGFLLISLKFPEYGTIVNLISQVFWLYSGYKAWREAGQVGVFIVSILITLVLIVGVVNYWIL